MQVSRFKIIESMLGTKLHCVHCRCMWNKSICYRRHKYLCAGTGVIRDGVDRAATTVCGCPDVFTAPVISPGSAPVWTGGRADSATKVVLLFMSANDLITAHCLTWQLCFVPADIYVCSREEPCQNGATCVLNDSGEYQCLCPEGFHGRDCKLKTGPCQKTKWVMSFNQIKFVTVITQANIIISTLLHYYKGYSSSPKTNSSN